MQLKTVLKYSFCGCLFICWWLFVYLLVAVCLSGLSD